MKKQYIQPATIMASALSQQLMAASGGAANITHRYTTVTPDVDPWEEIGTSDADEDTDLEHGQSASGHGSRAKYNPWTTWD